MIRELALFLVADLMAVAIGAAGGIVVWLVVNRRAGRS